MKRVFSRYIYQLSRLLPGLFPVLIAPSMLQGQDRYLEIRNGNVLLHLGATSEFRNVVEDFDTVGFNRIIVGTPDRLADDYEVVQPDLTVDGFTQAESAVIEMLISADRNPDRYAGLSPLAVKVILVAGARLESSIPGFPTAQVPFEKGNGAGLISRNRSLEIFAAGRRVPDGFVTRPMGWDKGILYKGFSNRYTIEIDEGGERDFAAALAFNPPVERSGTRLVAGTGEVRMSFALLKLDASDQVSEIVSLGLVVETVGHIYVPSLPAGRYGLEVVSDAESVYYGLSWHSQPHGIEYAAGNSNPIFLFREDDNGRPVEMGDTLRFSGTLFGALDDLVRIEYFAGGSKIGEGTHPEFSFSWIASRSGSEGIYAVATDRYGVQSFSGILPVVVDSPPATEPSVAGPVVPSDLSGVYFGTLRNGSQEGWVAISVRPSGRASLVCYLGSTPVAAFDRDGLVDTDGSFEFRSIHSLLPGSESGEDSDIGPWATGRIENGTLEGICADSSYTFSASRSGDSGPLEQLAGYFELSVINEYEGRVLLVMDGRGKTRMLVRHHEYVEPVFASISSPGAASISLEASRELLLDLDDSTGSVNGALLGGNGDDWELLGIRDSVERIEQFANISTRGVVNPGGGALIAGFIVEGTEPKRVLIRAVGPSLGQLGVEGAIGNPELKVWRSQGSFDTLVAVNRQWDSSTSLFSDVAETVGAFPLVIGAFDAATILTLEPGVYTAQMSDPNSTGLGLVEVYDVDAHDSQREDRIVNISTRGEVRGNSYGLVGGFVIDGNVPKRVLIRAVGPTLSDYGVMGALSDPVLYVDSFDNGTTIEITENDDWGLNSQPQVIRDASARIGAFPLKDGGKDAAVVVILKPGPYTATVRAKGSSVGIALFEVYEIPE